MTARPNAISDSQRALDSFGTKEGLDLEALSDACDALGIGRFVSGLRSLWHGAPPVAGPAVTMEVVCGDYPPSSRHHLGVDAVNAAAPGDVVVIDHRGRTDAAAWGGLLSTAAREAGVRGIIVDGGARDVTEAAELGLSLWGRGPVSRTARGRVTQRSVGQPIHFAGILVSPGDVVFIAEGGMLVVPQEHLDAVVARATEIKSREAHMADAVLRGTDLTDVLGASYETMLDSDS